MYKMAERTRKYFTKRWRRRNGAEIFHKNILRKSEIFSQESENAKPWKWSLLKSDIFRWRDIENEHFQKSHFSQWSGMMKCTFPEVLIFDGAAENIKMKMTKSKSMGNISFTKYLKSAFPLMVAYFLASMVSKEMFSGFQFSKIFFILWGKVKKDTNSNCSLFWWSPKNLHSVSAFFMFFAMPKPWFSIGFSDDFHGDVKKDYFLNLSTFHCWHGKYNLRNCFPFSFTRAISFISFSKPFSKPFSTGHPKVQPLYRGEAFTMGRSWCR